MTHYPRIGQFKTAAALAARFAELGHPLAVDDRVLSAADGSPLAAPVTLAGRTVGNRWCIHPMEGWDANVDGTPTDLTRERWRKFGAGGAKLIWGGEAAAVRPEGRANPRQTLATPGNRRGLIELRETLVAEHDRAFGRTDDLFVGLQLTHSGRFSKPSEAGPAPKVAYRHPLLERRFPFSAGDARVWTDAELETLIDDYVAAADVAVEAGYDFVDVKACHGYLLHEFLSARRRPGPFGGDFAGRTRLLTTIIDRIRGRHPVLPIGVRLSLYDTVPHVRGEASGDGAAGDAGGESIGDFAVGVPLRPDGPGPYGDGFGVGNFDPLTIDLAEPIRLVGVLQSLGVFAVNVTCGSPYYCPHIQRPAAFPPSDGYAPPEDPLVGVARLISATAALKRACPTMPLVGTGYTYLQDYLPHVAQAAVRAGEVDLVGLGRMVLSYPTLPADTLSGRGMVRKQVCRTFSDCTTAPRNGLVSGCYPLDPLYKGRPEAEQVKAIKATAARPPSAGPAGGSTAP